MFRTPVMRFSELVRRPFVPIFLIVIALALAAVAGPLMAQDQAPSTNDNPNKQETPPEAGGPQNDVGPYAIPAKRKKNLLLRLRSSPRRSRACRTTPSAWMCRW